MQVRSEHIQVLITVKTTPMPSTKYGDTVCVAGVRIDNGRCDWVRLYPIAFRWLDGETQFRKYDIIEMDVHRRSQDSRPESFSPVEDSIAVLRHLEGWSDRQLVLQNLPRQTTCSMRAAAVAHDAPSLGMVTVAEVLDLRLTPHPGWTADEQRKMNEHAARNAATLFDQKVPPPALRPPRFIATYRYRCTAAGCPLHDGRLLDWELTALQRRLHGSEREQCDEIRKKFLWQMFQPDRVTSFFMGNFENPVKRRNFSVLGVHYPPASIASRASLFDVDPPT